MKTTFLIASLALAAVGLIVPFAPASATQHSTSRPGMGQMMGQGMMGPGLMMPSMNPARGRKLFANKGCVVCHSVNGIGGEDAPPPDASTVPRLMNPFEFAAKMWRGAEESDRAAVRVRLGSAGAHWVSAAVWSPCGDGRGDIPVFVTNRNVTE